MIARIVTRCEVQMTYKEQEMLEKVVEWTGEALQDKDMPEGIQEILVGISDNISHLLSLVPEED